MDQPTDQNSGRGQTDPAGANGIARLHLLFGWWGLLFFLAAGTGLELLHAFKVGWYLDVGHETRRLMFTLGHAHGSLLSLLNVVFALCVLQLPSLQPANLTLASRCLLAGTILLPGGFLLAGVFVFGGDPGLAVFVVPIGALLLMVSVLLVALRVTRAGTGS